MAATTKLDDFTLAYIEAALWSTNDESDESGGEPLDSNYSTEDIAPEALEQIVADCAKFQAENAADIAAMPSRNGYKSAELAGHDFWLTRNGHGAGFWDRGLDELGERLTAAADTFGEVWPYVGDDGRIYGFGE
jgi:hypothetical protein